MNEFKYMLGKILKDQITGFEGVVTARYTYYSGMDRYTLKSTRLKADGYIQETIGFDEIELISTNKKIKIKGIPEPLPFKFSRGATVKCIHTGLTGIVMALANYLTGCNSYGIIPNKLTNDGTLFEWVWLPEDEIILVKEKKSKKKKKVDKSRGAPRFMGNISR